MRPPQEPVMRRFGNPGVCEVCGEIGLVWRDLPPQEIAPGVLLGATVGPERCDGCETVAHNAECEAAGWPHLKWPVKAE